MNPERKEGAGDALPPADAPKKAEKQEKSKEKGVISFPLNKKGRRVSRLMNFLRVLLYPIHFLIYPFKLHGPHKAGPGACIFVGNHYCIFDVFYPAHTTWEGIHFLSKQSVMDAPVVGAIAKKCGAIGALRDGSDVRTVMDSMRVLKNGEKLSIFPEGSRNKVSDEEFLPFHGGAALLSIKTKTPIIPFVICNRPKVFRVTHVVFGEPMEFSEYYGRKLTSADYEEADGKLRARLYELREEFRRTRAEKKAKKGAEPGKD